MSVADRLRGGQRAVAKGTLGLDHAKAREKLRMFRLPDPHFYVVQFVRAACALNATEIRFDVSTREVRCTFDRVVRGDLLQDIWAVAMEARVDDQTRALHYLGLGFGSAQALDPEVIEIQSGDVRVELRDESETTETVDGIEGTTITVREKLRFGHLFDFFESIRGEQAEVRALVDLCRHADIRLFVNSNLRSAADTGSFWRRFGDEQVSGHVCVSGLGELGTCIVTRDGLRLTSVIVDHHGQTAHAVLESSMLQTDLTGLNLSAGSDRHIEGMTHSLVYPNYHAALLKWLDTAAVRDDQKLSTFVGVLGYLNKLQDAGKEPRPETLELLRALEEESLFADALAQRKLSFAECLEAGTVHVSRHSFYDQNLSSPHRILLASKSGIPSLEQTLTNRFIDTLRRGSMYSVSDITQDLTIRAQAKQRREIWTSQAAESKPRRVLQIDVQMGKLRGAVYLSDEPEHITCVDARVLRRVPSSGPFGVWLDGDFTVRDDFVDIQLDESVAELWARLTVASADLLHRYAIHLQSTKSEEERRPRLLDSFMLAVTQGSMLDLLLDLMGLTGYLRGVVANHAVTQHLKEESISPHRTIARLGPIAKVESFTTLDGTSCDLETVLARDGWVLRAAQDWRELAGDVRRHLPEMASKVVLADSVQFELLRRLGLPSAATKIPGMVRRSKVLRQSMRPLLDGPGLRTGEANGIRARVLPNEGSQSTCILEVLINGRLLEETFLVVDAGSYRATVDSDRFQADMLGLGVEHNDTFDDARKLVLGLIADDLKSQGLQTVKDPRAKARANFLKSKPLSEPRVGPVNMVVQRGTLTCVCSWFPDPSRGAGKSCNIVTVMLEQRALDQLDVPTPFGAFRSRVSGVGFEPNEKYTAVEYGKEEIVAIAKQAAAACVRRACGVAIEARGLNSRELKTMRLDLLIALGSGAEPDASNPILPDLKRAPIFQMCDGAWVSAEDLRNHVHQGTLFASADGNHPEVLRVPTSEQRITARALEHLAPLTPFSGQVLTRRRAEPEDVLDLARAMLERARGSDWRLFDEELASNFVWAKTTRNPLCDVRRGVHVRATHPLAIAAKRVNDDVAAAFLASATYSAINAYYQEITDHDELELQTRLLRTLDE